MKQSRIYSQPDLSFSQKNQNSISQFKLNQKQPLRRYHILSLSYKFNEKILTQSSNRKQFFYNFYRLKKSIDTKFLSFDNGNRISSIQSNNNINETTKITYNSINNEDSLVNEYSHNHNSHFLNNSVTQTNQKSIFSKQKKRQSNSQRQLPNIQVFKNFYENKLFKPLQSTKNSNILSDGQNFLLDKSSLPSRIQDTRNFINQKNSINDQSQMSKMQNSINNIFGNEKHINSNQSIVDICNNKNQTINTENSQNLNTESNQDKDQTNKTNENIYRRQMTKEEQINNIQNVIRSYNILNTLLIDSNNKKDQIIEVMNTLQELTYRTGEFLPQQHARYLFLSAQIYKDLGLFRKSLFLFRQTRIFCNVYRIYRLKLKVYTEQIDIYQQMQEFKKAQKLLQKLLKLSWKLNIVEYEIKAYDMIGLNYYYQNDLELALYFHQRCVNDRPEPQGTPLRVVGESQVPIKTDNLYQVLQNDNGTDSEDEFDLANFKQNFTSVVLPQIKKIHIPIPIELRRKKKQAKLGRTDMDQIKILESNVPNQDMTLQLTQLSSNRNIDIYFSSDTHKTESQVLGQENFDKANNIFLNKHLKRYQRQIIGSINVLEQRMYNLLYQQNQVIQ